MRQNNLDNVARQLDRCEKNKTMKVLKYINNTTIFRREPRRERGQFRS